MCGIAGVFHYAEPDRPVDRDLLARMTHAIAHRGPDGEGFYVKDNLGLGHRRLSIVDLTPTGAQPMATEDGTKWITYNGEFYNHHAFRGRLIAKGCRFRGTSDTETLLHLLNQEGPDCLEQVAGIFGFAYWDGPKKTLTLARDPLGVKQLYYHDNGRRIVFASEIKGLLVCSDVPREPDPEAINQYLHFHTALFERTFFKNIRQVRAGEYLQITPYGSRMRRYWNLTDFTPSAKSTDELIGQLGEMLTQTVGEQFMSDVPVGSFFSGGIDSSAIAAHALKNGHRPICFGVHFPGGDVVDEGPYQEAAAKALGLELQLTSMDGSRFPENLRTLLYHQDEPVIGAAMFPMYEVSKVAVRQVKVCLGGQAADELFGGYARYALGHPMMVLQSWFAGRQGQTTASGQKSRVGGNLLRQLLIGRNLTRLVQNARNLGRWESSYFEHVATVPEARWLGLFASPEFCDRERCQQVFHETLARSAAVDPLDKLMHWDVQTYLTGLFHQDDRMSMANSLESRVPFADPRLVRFAFHIHPYLKLRGGASKWILRQAVSEALPAFVLNRRKVGFDTPAERWVTETHAGFVRETLLSSRALQRGLWNKKGLEVLLDNAGVPGTFPLLWKALAIETWASLFLESCPEDTAPRDRAMVPHIQSEPSRAQYGSPQYQSAMDLLQEARELGARGTLARGWRELKSRGVLRVARHPSGTPSNFEFHGDAKSLQLPFAHVKDVGEALGSLVPVEGLKRLQYLASEATRGRILCFSNWMADFGQPIDWHRNPVDQKRWPSDVPSARALVANQRTSEVKFLWEAARFPQAYVMARAATFDPAAAEDMAAAFRDQVESFMEMNPTGLGVNWSSGQEIIFRILAWLFGISVFSDFNLIPADHLRRVMEHLFKCGLHVAEHIEYARRSVYNNHLLSEALGLYVIGSMFPAAPEAMGWREQGFQLLVEQADRQIYPDGGYIQLSHNYQRVAMHTYLCALAFCGKRGESVPPQWIAAMERSLDFLSAHQDPSTGELPNHGGNDGSLLLPLTTCRYSEFRPTLQALSVATRGIRLYPRGPWDELSIWLFGPRVMELPIRPSAAKSVSFGHTGYHVLRGVQPETFAGFRCGTVLDRFAQIDMLHLDVWWRGENVLVDAGTYLYNGAQRWHNHFMRTENHNTVMVDERDQMLHHRQFKCLYPTEAELLRFEDHTESAICEGEHYGYRRRQGRPTHRRAVLFVKDDLWVVADTISGTGLHRARLHWLAGDYPSMFDPANCCLTIQTPRGEFTITVLDLSGTPQSGDVVIGRDDPCRGWLSRHFGEKVAVPSFAVGRKGELPMTFVSVLTRGVPQITVTEGTWKIRLDDRSVEFEIRSGSFTGPIVVVKRTVEAQV